MPRERIEPGFIERATGDSADAPASPPAITPPNGPGWIGTAKSVLRGLGFGS